MTDGETAPDNAVYTCPNCQKPIQVPPDTISVYCATCKNWFTIVPKSPTPPPPPVLPG